MSPRKDLVQKMARSQSPPLVPLTDSLQIAMSAGKGLGQKMARSESPPLVPLPDSLDLGSSHHSAKKRLGFTHPNVPKQHGGVEVIVHYESGDRTTIIKKESHRKIITTIARGHNVEHIVAGQISKTNVEAVVKATAKVVMAECRQICQDKSDSLLKRKTYDEMFQFNLEKFSDEMKSQCPTLFAILEAAVSDSTPGSGTKHFRQMLMAACIALNSRNPRMSVMHHFVGYVLMQGGSTQRTMERLSQLGLCVHPVTVQRKLLTWQGELDAELLIMRDSWADGGTVKYQLIGDNWDKNILPTYRTSDRNTISLHLFNMYAVVDRIIPPPSDVFTRLADPEQLKASDFIPSGVEQATLKRELTFLFAEIIIANIESVEEVMDNCYPQHLAHEYSHMAGTKTTQFPLGIFDCNEIFTQEMVNLMTHTLDKYVPKNQGDIVEAVFLGGDRLTDERAQIAQDSVRNGSTPTKRLEGFISKIEDFHRLMNFLEALVKMTYDTKSIGDKCSMYFFKTMLNAKDVKANVKNSYRPYKNLYYRVLEGICVVLFLNHFGIEDLEASIPGLDEVKQMSKENKIDWLNNVCSSLIQKWFFDNTDDIFEELREVLDDENNEENYWVSNMKDGRFGCHHCQKTYKYLTSLKDHEKQVHNITIKKKTSTKKGSNDEYLTYIIMLFRLSMLHRNLDSAVDMGDGRRVVRSAKYELPIYHKTNKIKYSIGSIHLTALTSGLLPREQEERLIHNRFVNVQGGKGNNIALDEYLEMLNRDSKVACTGYKTKETIIRHSKEYPHLTHATRRVEAMCSMRGRKGFHHKPSYKKDVAKIAKHLIDINILEEDRDRKFKCKKLVADRNPFRKCEQGLAAMIHRHRPILPFRRLKKKA